MIIKDLLTQTLLTKLFQYISKQVCCVSSASCMRITDWSLFLIQQCWASYSTAGCCMPCTVPENILFHSHRIHGDRMLSV